MYGIFISQISGLLGENITLRNSSDGKPYCYFRVAIGKRPTTDANGNKKEREPDWLNMSANGATATALAQYVHKGMALNCTARGRTTQKVVEKDGVKTVYNDIVFEVMPGLWNTGTDRRDSSDASPEDHKSAPAHHDSAQAPDYYTAPASNNYEAQQPVANVTTSPEDDFDDAPTTMPGGDGAEGDVFKSLPF